VVQSFITFFRKIVVVVVNFIFVKESCSRNLLSCHRTQVVVDLSAHLFVHVHLDLEFPSSDLQSPVQHQHHPRRASTTVTRTRKIVLTGCRISFPCTLMKGFIAFSSRSTHPARLPPIQLNNPGFQAGAAPDPAPDPVIDFEPTLVSFEIPTFPFNPAKQA
jgi:hypothetical protein